MGNSLEDIQTGDQLLQHLGSFWAQIFGGNDKLRQYTRGLAQSQAQNYLNYLETVANVSRFTIPVFHTENWYLLTITRSEVAAVASAYRPGDLVYGPQTGVVADRPMGFVQTYGGQDKPGVVEVPLRAPLVGIPFNLQNFVLKPTKVWAFGIDYYIDTLRNLLVFRDDPFSNPLVPKRDVFNANGVKVDEEIALWVYKGEFDLQYVWTQFGYALGLQLPSSQFYKDILNAFWDMHLLGPALSGLQQFLTALSGDPLVINPREVVEVIWEDNDNILVITDLSVYKLPTSATVIVTVGQSLVAGDAISDAVRVVELSGANPDYSILPALCLSKDFLSGNYLSDLTFRNQSVALEYKGLDAAGKAIVQFQVSGFPGDVDAFWGSVQTNGEKPGQRTLAELLDTRTNPVGQPGPTNFPATVNPMQFIFTNLLRNNLFVIKVNQGSFDPVAPGVSLFGLLREVMPPHINYVVFVNLDISEEDFDLGDVDSADDSAEGFFANNGPLLDQGYVVGSSPPPNVLTYGDIAVFARQYSLTCQ